ncbi:hypothetical protein F4703DRAFT_1850254 [Phycomyces blakesleeanus]
MSSTLKTYDIAIVIDFGTTASGFKILNLNGLEPNPDYTYDYDSGSDSIFYHKYTPKDEKEPSTLQYRIFSNKYYHGREADYQSVATSFFGNYASEIKLWIDGPAKKDLPEMPHNTTLLKLISDYLRVIRKDAHKSTPKMFPTCTDSSRYRYCMAAPTMWSEKSKNIMREAAIIAGFITKYDKPERLLIIDEVVAAALYAEHMSPGIILTNGSLYMVCDAGGGTVDLATFEKDDSPGMNGLKEVTVGAGSSCGSVYLDFRFKGVLQGQGKAIHAQDYKIAAFGDYLKPYFDITDAMKECPMLNSPKTTYDSVDFGSNTFDGIPLDEIRINVFDPVVNQVLEMMKKQFAQIGDRNVDAMFITGGFGRSPYLQRRIKDTFGDRINEFKVIGNGHMAVIEGAALFCASPRPIAQRILRRTYGIKICSPDDRSKKDTESEKDKFHVYIRKGEPVKEDTWVTKSMIWKHNTLPIISLYTYDDNDDDQIPEFPTAKDIELVAIFNTRFKLDAKKDNPETMIMKIRFGLDKIEVKVEIADRNFEYITVWDISGEKNTRLYSEPNPPFSVIMKKMFLIEWMAEYFL